MNEYVCRCRSNKILQEHVYKEKKKNLFALYMRSVILDVESGWSGHSSKGSTEYRKVRGRESLKLTDGGLDLHPQIRRDLRRVRLLAAHRPGV